MERSTDRSTRPIFAGFYEVYRATPGTSGVVHVVRTVCSRPNCTNAACRSEVVGRTHSSWPRRAKHYDPRTWRLWVRSARWPTSYR